jgi:hypothetical protein
MPLPSFFDLPHMGGNATASPLLPFHSMVGTTPASFSSTVVAPSVGPATVSPSSILAGGDPRVVEVNKLTSTSLYRQKERREGIV